MKTTVDWLAGMIMFLVLPMWVDASRLHRPMGDYVREADLIVAGDTRRGGEKAYDRVLIIKEVLKGDAKAVGTEILLPMKRSTGDAYIPTPATNIAVLLRKGGPDRNAQVTMGEKGWTPLEAYSKAEDVAAVRMLVQIYRLPEERQQLMALREKALAGHERCLAQLLADLANMRQPDNFGLMTDLYDAFAPTNQTKLVEIIARTSDLRAVPALIKAMQSADETVSSTAARYLAWHFPGAPGLNEAFERALTQKHLAREAARYLAKRREDPKLEELKGQDTPWVRAERLWKAGKREEARLAFMAMITDANTTPFASRHAALKLLPEASPAEKEGIRKALLKQLTTLASAGNYLEMGEAARILSELRHPDCLPALLAILPRTDVLYWRAARTATIGVRELGSEARQQAITHLIENLGATAAKAPETDARTVYLLGIIWLGDKESYLKAANAIPEFWQTDWKALRPLAAIALEKDEGASLVQILSESSELPMRAREWVIFRLGDLKEQRAVKVLTDLLKPESHYYLVEAIKDALKRIGGAEVEREMLALLTHESHSVRDAATHVLFHIQGERSRHLARRMLQEENYGLKQPAMLHLGTFGTREDLQLLLPFCDYWKADRATHYWAAQAVSSIRDRYNYDVNGPSLKAP